MTKYVIKGEVQGYDVEVHLTSDDLQGEDDIIEPLKEIKIGAVQAAIMNMEDHGILAKWKKKSDEPVAAGKSDDKASQPSRSSSKAWECPEHGSQYVYPAKFGEGNACNKWIEVEDDDSELPNWSTKRVSDVKGQLRTYCKYREVPNTRRR